MAKPESNTIVTVPKPYTVELIKRPRKTRFGSCKNGNRSGLR
jgi:hypothetical protein